MHGMMGRRSEQRSLFTADSQYLEFVGRDSFYGFLAIHGPELFSDDEFADFYCHTVGRTSIPPSRLMIALILQTYDRVSDEEAKKRADFDLRWKVALGVEVDDRPFAKSTLQEFRAQLLIHDKAQSILARTLELAKEQGVLRKRHVRMALDSTMVLGRGAVKDTYNLIGDGIVKLCRALASVSQSPVESWASGHGYERYFGSSLKGEAGIDWDDEEARQSFLTSIIADGERLLELARETRSELEAGCAADVEIAEAAELLSRLLWQDVEPTDRGGHRIKKGTAKDRIPSVHDPEQRHGHKSQERKFTGHKATVAVDVESGLVLATDVIPGNEPDGKSASELVEQAESNAEVEADQVIGDTAYGSVEVRASLGDREVIAPTVKPRSKRVTKLDFEIDVEGGVVRCPEGHETRDRRPRTHPSTGEKTHYFVFPGTTCRECPRYGECVPKSGREAGRGSGRTILLHPDEARLQEARSLERTEYFRDQYRDRVTVEHKIGRLVQLGIRQARYFGRAKTCFQVLMAAVTANLTRVSAMDAEGGRMHGQKDGPTCAPKGHGGLMTVVKAITGLFRSLTSHGKTSEPMTAQCALT